VRQRDGGFFSLPYVARGEEHRGGTIEFLGALRVQVRLPLKTTYHFDERDNQVKRRRVEHLRTVSRTSHCAWSGSGRKGSFWGATLLDLVQKERSDERKEKR